MNINRQAVSKLTKNTRNTSVACTIVMPAFSRQYPDYAYVPYNKNWGNRETVQKLSVHLLPSGHGIFSKENAGQKLLEALYHSLGESKVKNSKYSNITFSFLSKNGELFIDTNTFSFFKKKNISLESLEEITVSLPVTVFLSLDGQNWVNEKSYMEYAMGMRITYQCSDDTVAHSYQEFKDWECELAYRPHNPIYPTYEECENTLSSIGYLELSADGTIWRSQTILEEYVHWQQDENYGMEDGVYVGRYGTASNFIEYTSLYNVAYYSNAGLKRTEQFYGAHGFLYATSEKALESIDKLNSFQKVKK